MNCDEFQKQLEEAIDRQLDGNSGAEADRESVMAGLETHATGCETCRESWQDFVLLEQAVADWRAQPRTPQLSSDFTERVLREAFDAGLRSDETASTSAGLTKPALVSASGTTASVTREPKPIRAWEILVTVALVLIAVLVVFRDGGNQIAENEVEDNPSSPFESPPDNELVDLSDLLSDARIVLSSLTERASEKAGGFRVFVPDVTNSFTLEGGASPTAIPAPERTPQVDDDSSSDSESDNSNSDGFRRALDFLFEAAGPTDQQTT
jgi:hypothetical protein